MEEILASFGGALEAAVDDVHRVARAARERAAAAAAAEQGSSPPPATRERRASPGDDDEREQISAFLSRIEDLKESLEYSERLYERTAPSLQEMLKAGRAKRDQNAWLLAAVCRERGHASTRKGTRSPSAQPAPAGVATPRHEAGPGPAATPSYTGRLRSSRKTDFVQSELKPRRDAENAMRGANLGAADASLGRDAGPAGTTPLPAGRGKSMRTPLPSSLHKAASRFSIASDCDSDPRTPTLEDFGLADRYADFDEKDAVPFAGSPPREALAETQGGSAGRTPPPKPKSPEARSPPSTTEGPADCFLLEEDLDALPSYVQTQVDVPTLNKVLDLVSNRGRISLPEIEKVASSSGATGSGKALVLALLELGRLESAATKDTYRLVQ